MRLTLALGSLTDQLVRTAIAAGADILTIHGRTRHQSSAGHPVNLDSIRFAVDSAKGDVPCIANGDLFSVKEAEETRRRCNVQGVMSARGLLANPVRSSGIAPDSKPAKADWLLRQALFAGYEQTPLSAIAVSSALLASASRC